MKMPAFVPNKVYKRSEIHDQYGGNRQYGISCPAKQPYIFIFSGNTGHKHGYIDRWENANVFSYTGEGQEGDMNFVRGNLELRDHIANGKKVFLFIAAQRSYMKFEGEVELIVPKYFQAPDTNGKERTAIKFFFRRAHKHLNYENEINALLEDTPEYEVGKSNIPNVTERKGLITSRVGQGAYRASILFRWEFKCAVTNYSNNEILIASHIVPWRDATNEERLDVNNGILLSPTYDALFDQNLIGFENNGKIILSSTFEKTDYQSIGVTGKEIIKKFSKENFGYLERHREMMLL